MDNRVTSEADIVEASKIVVADGLKPTRIVLRNLGSQYVTHVETLTSATPTDGTACAFVHDSFESGNYFRFDNYGGEIGARKYAYADFLDRSYKL